jgi:DNA-binding transcriptional LysR family regulator
LVERQGQGIRLTPNGRELARISRFFLLGLSNFQRGCLAEGQTYRIGAGATFIQMFLIPALAQPRLADTDIKYSLETVPDGEIERRLHDLTLDFGMVTAAVLSRPLQLKPLCQWRLELLVPKRLCRDRQQAQRAFREKRLPLVLAKREPALQNQPALDDYDACLTCGDFIEANQALACEDWAALLPDFFPAPDKSCLRLRLPEMPSLFQYHLAWNPRLLRLNPHATRRREVLFELLAGLAKTSRLCT